VLSQFSGDMKQFGSDVKWNLSFHVAVLVKHFATAAVAYIIG
jgi:hypothetical protein